jgi:septin family protein
MIKWLCNVIFKEYIDELVDQRFKENAYEQYRAEQTQGLRNRSAAIRAAINNSSQRLHEKTQEALQSDSNTQRSAEPGLQVKATKAPVKIEPDWDAINKLKAKNDAAEAKSAELNAMKAKLMGKK